MNTPKAILYTRVSTCGQAEHGTSLDEQFASCTKRAEQLGAQVVGHEEDAGVSGGFYTARPGMQAALATIEAGQADTLIIANLSRFSRDREHQSAIKKRVQAAGGRLVFCDMDFDDTPEGDLAFGIMGTFADYERKAIRARTMKGRRRRAETGLQPSRGRSPYGYRVVTNGDVLAGLYPLETLGTYQIVEDEAKWVREIYRRYAEGASMERVCIWLNGQGVPVPKDGAYWRRTTIKRIIENPAYKGAPTFGKTENRYDEGRLNEGCKTPRFQRTRPAEQWIVLSCGPLVLPALWQACQDRIGEARARYSGNPKRKYLLSGLFRCPTCGGTLTAQTKKEGLRYRCRAAEAAHACGGDAGRCNLKQYDGQAAGDFLISAFLSLVQQPGILHDAARLWQESLRRSQQGDGVVEAKPLQDRLKALDVRERSVSEALVECVTAGGSRTVFTDMLREIAAERGRLEAALTSLMPAAPTGEAAFDVVTALDVLRALTDVLTSDLIATAEKRDLLARVVRGVTPKGDEYEAQVVCPTAEGIAETVPFIVL